MMKTMTAELTDWPIELLLLLSLMLLRSVCHPWPLGSSDGRSATPGHTCKQKIMSRLSLDEQLFKKTKQDLSFSFSWIMVRFSGLLETWSSSGNVMIVFASTQFKTGLRHDEAFYVSKNWENEEDP